MLGVAVTVFAVGVVCGVISIIIVDQVFKINTKRLQRVRGFITAIGVFLLGISCWMIVGGGVATVTLLIAEATASIITKQ